MSAATPKQPASVFNQAAEDRLKELLEKRKRDKLTRAEVLEVRELQLLKAAAELAKKRAACAADRRKLADQDRYRLGGFALTAGLGGWSDAELRAGFAVLAAMDATQRAELPPVAANADSKAGGDAVAAPVTSATVSTLMPAPMSGAKAAPPAQAQAEPMAAAMPASASMSHESRRFGG
ncbi:MAG: hypothetical protein LGL72_18040 [Acidibrevibacterium sp.]|uniref:hypothetical protein n=1 Tax=Acidibrevibacterium fodinaquatile TaxID=1969806 RepID=UPI0023A85409|nr:hypothetical protein [Acidibrevibacterium fodinaquatile]MCA7121247.1 hypothetical protein [Acidibrevibacterium fodinaquatile]